MKNVIIKLLGLEPQPMRKNIITTEMWFNTTNPSETLPFDKWKRKYKVSSQFSFLDSTHYTQKVVGSQYSFLFPSQLNIMLGFRGRNQNIKYGRLSKINYHNRRHTLPNSISNGVTTSTTMELASAWDLWVALNWLLASSRVERNVRNPVQTQHQ